MKRMVVFLVMPAAVATCVAARPRVVTYTVDAQKNVDKKAKQALRLLPIGLNLPNPLRGEVRGMLLGKGVRSFVETDGGADPCEFPGKAIVCFSIGRPYAQPFQGWGSSTGWTSNGNSFSEYAAQNGDQYTVPVYATLIDARGRVQQLGMAISSYFGGASYGTTVSNTAAFGGSASISGVVTPEQAIAIATARAIGKLVDKRWWKTIVFDPDTHEEWYPGAAEAIAEAFKTPPPAPELVAPLSSELEKRPIPAVTIPLPTPSPLPTTLQYQ